jgi:hypothetical protein
LTDRVCFTVLSFADSVKNIYQKPLPCMVF